jgi:hypothetical protein
MPLIHRKSEKAFKKNIETEMEAHPGPENRARDLAIAYSVKRKAKKASGGTVNSGSKDMDMAKGGKMRMADGGSISASDEKRPMPDNSYDDEHQVSRNSGNKPPKNDSWTDRPDMSQSQKGGKFALKHPKMVPQSIYSTRLRDEEDDLQMSAKTNEGPQHQPPEHDNEEGPDRQGPAVEDMEDEHSTHRKPYAKGGMIDEMKHPSKHYMQPEDHNEEAMERRDESDLQEHADPSMDEGSMKAESLDEMDQDRQGPEVPDMEDEHSSGRKPYADGGSIQFHDSEDNMDDMNDHNPADRREIYADEMDTQPEDEEADEHESSVAAAVMARMKRMGKLESGSEDEDMSLEDEPRHMRARTYAEGGEILPERRNREIKSHDSIYADDSDMADMSRNADEDANEEDQVSYNALRKENYNTSYLDRDQPEDSNMIDDKEEKDSENQHDNSLVSRIRSKMKKRSPMTK